MVFENANVKCIVVVYTAKSVTKPFKEHGTEVEEVCQQIANEVVTLITIYLQAENVVDDSVTHIERRNSLVETSLGRNWQTGSFTGSFSSNNKNKLDSSKFTINFMEKLQCKVRSKQQSSSVDTEELHRSLQKSLTKSDSVAAEQVFTEDDEETMRQLLNPDTGDADDIASQIVDRIPEDVLDLLNMKFASSSNTLPGSAEDPIESAHSIILEVLINAMSAELSDEESSTPGKPTLQKQVSKNSAKKVGATGPAISIDKPEVSTNVGRSSLPKQLSASKSPALVKKISTAVSVDKPEAGTQDGTTTKEGSSSLINAQLMFSQITTTIACAVIEKLKEALHNTSNIIEAPEDGPALPFLSRPDNTDKEEKTEHDQQASGENSANTNQANAQQATAVADDEYEEDMVIVTYGSFVNFPGEFYCYSKAHVNLHPHIFYWCNAYDHVIYR